MAEEVVSSVPLQLGASLPGNVVCPAKRLLNNQSEVFVEQRRGELEQYLSAVLANFRLLPEPLTRFIDWHLYEVHGVTQALAVQLAKYEKASGGDSVFEIHNYQLAAVAQSKAVSSLDDGNPQLAEVLEALSELRRVRVLGSSSRLFDSNIEATRLCLDLSLLRSLEHLELHTVDPRVLRGLGTIQQSLRTIVVRHSLDSVKQLTLAEQLSECGEWPFGDRAVEVPAWHRLIEADLAHNRIRVLDSTIALMPNLQQLRISCNHLSHIPSLVCLVRLRSLDVSHNQLCVTEESGGSSPIALSSGRPPPPPSVRLAKRLPSGLTTLNLAGNGLTSCDLIRHMACLQKLDLSDNRLLQLAELDALRDLPLLCDLVLRGNPLAQHPYYRRDVFNLLGDRYDVVTLDGARLTSQEKKLIDLHRAVSTGIGSRT